jgi:ectoine hydroxylase
VIAPIDPYRSRVDSSWEPAERVDPVLHGVNDGPLDTDQLEAFARDGFLVLRGWLTAGEAEQALDDAAAVAEARRGTDDVIAEPDSDVVRSVFRVHDHGAFIPTLCRDARMAGVARQILGSDVYMHQSRVNYKPALDGREFFWHSDFETWHVEDGMPRMRALSASISLTETTEFNGPLMLIPGSHRTYVRCVGETPERHYETSLRRQEVGVPGHEALSYLVDRGGIVAPKGPPGTVVFFDCNTMHGSVGNLSPMPRTNLFFVFNSVENGLVEPFSGQPPRPRHIAEREIQPL